MTFKIFNDKLRTILLNFTSDGFQQNDISKITFGNNRQDQLKQFLSGRDISGKPLKTIFEQLGFEIHLVPVLKKNTEEIEKLSNQANDSLEALQLIFLDYLENSKRQREQKSGIIVFVDEILNKINRR